MSYDEIDYGDPHEDCVSTDDVFTYACENHWDELEEVVGDSKSQEWLSQTKSCIELLSIVSQRDQAHMRGALKKQLRVKQSSGERVTEEQLFSIASDVSAFLEQLAISHPYSKVLFDIAPDGYEGQAPTAARCIAFSSQACSLENDLSWARDLLTITRAFRDFLSAVSDADLQAPHLHLRMREPVKVFNSYLRKTPAQLLVFWQNDKDKKVAFGRCPDPKSSDLSSFIANWISDYLKDHYSHISLGACAECGKFFARERRDKTFCSKTCQNRVAYRRKKLLESDALLQINIAPDDACDITAGLWIHHPRFGIGLVEAVSSASKPPSSLPKSVATKVDEVRYRSMLSRKAMVQVRFLHGVRILGYADLFEGQKKEEQVPTFYEVKSDEVLAELL
jgi:hypothetical protein